MDKQKTNQLVRLLSTNNQQKSHLHFYGGEIFIELIRLFDLPVQTKGRKHRDTGMYGDEWNYEDITSFKLMENLPEVT